HNQLGRVLNWFLFYLEDQALNEISSCSKVMEISIAVGYLYCAIVFYKKKGVRIFFLDLFNKYIFASSDIEEGLAFLKIT
ncbi:hypothetical protein, partial [Enterococcus faecium]